MNNCPHLNVTVHWHLYAVATLYDPAEYVGRAHCQDCGEWMEPEDVSDFCECSDPAEMSDHTCARCHCYIGERRDVQS